MIERSWGERKRGDVNWDLAWERLGSKGVAMDGWEAGFRAWHGLLATADRTVKMSGNVAESILCKSCVEVNDSAEHSMRYCTEARKVWMATEEVVALGDYQISFDDLYFMQWERNEDALDALVGHALAECFSLFQQHERYSIDRLVERWESSVEVWDKSPKMVNSSAILFDLIKRWKTNSSL